MVGKIAGFIVGLLVGLALRYGWGAFIFAIVGVVIGHQLDVPRRRNGNEFGPPRGRDELFDEGDDDEAYARAVAARPNQPADPKRQFANALCAIFVEVARVDGEVVREEIRAMRHFFEFKLRFSAAELEQVRWYLKDAIAQRQDLGALARHIAQSLPESDRTVIAFALYDVGLSDGALSKLEREAIKRAISGMGISDADHRSIAAIHLGDEGDRQYATLGLSPDATDDEVKSAFRRLASAHHPDKFAHLGPGALAMATARFREIKDAYDEIRRLRGM